jgi:hypothetical protein
METEITGALPVMYRELNNKKKSLRAYKVHCNMHAIQGAHTCYMYTTYLTSIQTLVLHSDIILLGLIHYWVLGAPTLAMDTDILNNTTILIVTKKEQPNKIIL